MNITRHCRFDFPFWSLHLNYIKSFCGKEYIYFLLYNITLVYYYDIIYVGFLLLSAETNDFVLRVDYFAALLRFIPVHS